MSWKQKIAARLSNPPKLGNNKALKRQRGAAHGRKPFTSQSRALHFSVEPASWQNVLRDGCISQKNTPYRSHVSCHTPFFCRNHDVLNRNKFATFRRGGKQGPFRADKFQSHPITQRSF